MKRQRSLRRELSRGLSLGLLALWLLAGLAASVVLRDELTEVYDSNLQQAAGRILPLAVTELVNSGDNANVTRISPVDEGEQLITYVIRDAAGMVLMYSHDAQLDAFPGTAQPGFSETENLRIFSASALSGSYVIQVAEPLTERREALRETMVALFAPLVILLPLSFFAIAWLTRRALRPVAALSNEVAARDGSDLSPLVTAPKRAELEPIHAATNRLLAQLSNRVEAERGFTSNAAHELRTPIAAALAQTQRLVTEAPEGPLQDRARRVEAELKRLTALSGKLLELSRAEGGQADTGREQDIAPVLQLIVQDFAVADAGNRLQVTLPSGPVVAKIDLDAFAILSRNLIENALLHSPPETPVIVDLAPNGTLTVTNDCPVVSPENLARLTLRFERAGARGPGSGLGLAIVAGIVQTTGAQLRLLSPAPGRKDGFMAQVMMP